MSQTIQITITGSFPSYQIAFSAAPSAVPFNTSTQIVYQLPNGTSFSIVGVNLQRDPFASGDELTWTLPANGHSLTFNDSNTDPQATKFGVEIIFRDKSGNQFSSTDPVIINEGEQ